MGSMYKAIGVLALVAAAALLHNFYVAYSVNAETYIISWNSPSHVHDQFVKAVAAKSVRPELTVRKHNRYANNGFPRYRDNPENGCVLLKPLDGPQPQWGLKEFLDFHGNYRCTRPWPKKRWTDVVHPAITFEDALAKARAAHPNSKYGMVPSLTSAGPEPSRTATAKSLWLGVILPAALLAVALALLLSVLHAWHRRSDRPKPE